MLPVGGGAGVQDVLFGCEQGQAVGIKVHRSRAHDGKRSQTAPAAALFSGPDGGVSAGKQPQWSAEARWQTGKVR